ncbi:MAG: hypothetical protein WDW38_008162 [Sanguina aurantia]
MSFAFKKFNFFVQNETASNGFPKNSTCHTQGSSALFVGCDNGSVHALDESFNLLYTFNAHGHKVLEVLWLEGRRLLLTVGVEEPGFSSSSLKLWDVDKISLAKQAQQQPTQQPQQPKSSGWTGGSVTVSGPVGGNAAGTVPSGPPQPFKSVKLFSAKYPESDVTAVAAKESVTGGGDSSGSSSGAVGGPGVTVAVGLGSGFVYLLSADLSAKGKIVHTGKISARPEREDLCGVYGLQLQGDADLLSLFVVTESQTLSFNLQTNTKTMLDQQGSRVRGCCALKASLLVVAREAGLFDYSLDTRAGCTVFEGVKTQLEVLRRFLLVVSRDTSPSGVSTAVLSLLDVRNRLVAGSFSVADVRHVMVAWGAVVLITGSGRLFTFTELGLASQLESLFKRSLHKLALDVARAVRVDAATEASIHTQWADHLYSKGEYDAAMAHYIEAIGCLEPSTVIRRFLDAPPHTQPRSIPGSPAHQGPCLCRPHHAAAELLHEAEGRASLKFDAETAVKVLRGAGYPDQALWVAHQACQPEWMLEIMIDDMGDYSQAISFLVEVEGNSRAQCAELVRKYGKALVTHRPVDTTRLLGELCTMGVDTEGTAYAASVADFAHLYSERPTDLMLLCEFILNTSSAPASEPLLYHTLLQLYLTGRMDEGGRDSRGPPGAGRGRGGAAATATAAAVDRASAEERMRRRERALELLSSGWPSHLPSPKYDPDTSLLLCRLSDFHAGLVFLYDKLRLPREVYMSTGDHSALIAATIKYGDGSKGGDTTLWGDVLEHFVAQEGDCTPWVSRMLELIEQGSILPPLVVLQMLAKNKGLQMRVVRGYVARQLQAESSEVARDREAISRLASETASMKAELLKLKTKARVFQNSRCSASSQPLDLPVVHFLCGHSFNVRALGDSDSECPLCGPDFKRVLDIKRSMQIAAMQQDRFFTELRENADGFAVVAEHFGRGLMNMTNAAANPVLGPSS